MHTHYLYLLELSQQHTDWVLKDFSSLPGDTMKWRPSPQVWSALDVIDHLNKVYALYLDNFQRLINEAPILDDAVKSPVQRTLIGRMAIFGCRPKHGRRRMKIKTFDFFQPTLEDPKVIMTDFSNNKDRFHTLIKTARNKDVRGIKIQTALGSKVKFYIPECFEFLLVHEQRHLVQIQELLDRHQGHSTF